MLGVCAPRRVLLPIQILFVCLHRHKESFRLSPRDIFCNAEKWCSNHKRRKANNLGIGNFTEANRLLVAKMGLSNVQWNYSAIKNSVFEQLSELRAFDSNWYDSRNITNEVKGTVIMIAIITTTKCKIILDGCNSSVTLRRFASKASWYHKASNEDWNRPGSKHL